MKLPPTVVLPVFALVSLFSLQPASQAQECEMLFSKPIPAKSYTASASSYHELPINVSGPLNQEPLVDIADYGIAGEAFYARKDKLNAPYFRCICPEDSPLKLRRGTAKKLQEVNKRLSPLGLELFVFDAHRPNSCQKALWDYFLASARHILGPGASEDEVRKYANTYCANPTSYDVSNPKTWSSHVTGGAADLTIRRKTTGELVFMGSTFDDDSDVSFTRHFEDYNKSSAKPFSTSDAEARRNRRLLYWVMTEAGFANLADEWWHFDYGTQLWAQITKPDKDAFYGAIER